MALKGDLASVDLAQVFQMLALNQKVGMLCISSPKGWRALYFEPRGACLYFDEHVMLDKVVLQATRHGTLDAEDLREARRHAAAHGMGLADALIAGGYLTESDLLVLLRGEMEEEIYDLFFWTEAHFEFYEGATSVEGREGHVDPRFVFSTDTLIMEAARRIDEWSFIQERVEGPLEVYRPVGNVKNVLDLEDSALATYDLVDGKRNVARLIETTGLPAFLVYKGIAVLLEDGLVEAVPPEELLATAHECENEGRLQDAINLYEKSISLGVGIPNSHARAAEVYETLQEFELASYHHKCVAEFHAQADDAKAAVEIFKHVVAVIPTDLGARERLVELSVGRADLATKDFDPIKNGKELVDLCLEIGEVERVRGILERLLRDNPFDIELKKSLINVHTKAGDSKRVVELYESIAEDLVQNRKPLEAIKYLQKILMLDRNRKDISERIRSLYVLDERRRNRRRSAVALTVFSVLLVVLGALWWFYDQHARDRFATIEARVDRLLESRDYHNAIDEWRTFQEQIPFTLVARDVDVELSRIESLELKHQEQLEQERRRREEDLDRLRQRYKAAWSSVEALIARQDLDAALGQVEQVAAMVAEANQPADTQWAKSVNLEGNLTGLRKYIATAFELDRSAREALSSGDWRAARQHWSELVQKYPLAELSRVARLPVMVTSRPAGAVVMRNGAPVLDDSLGGGQPKRTPCVLLCGHETPEEYRLQLEGFGARDFAIEAMAHETVDVVLEAVPVGTLRFDEPVRGALVAERGYVAAGLRGGHVALIRIDDGRQVVHQLGGLDAVDGRIALTAALAVYPTVDGNIEGLSLASGQVSWRLSPKTGPAFDLLVHSDRVLFIDTRNRLVAYDATRGGDALWFTPALGPVVGTPVIHGLNIIVTLATGGVLLIDAREGSVVERIAIDATLVTPAIGVGGTALVTATSDGRVIAARLDTGRVTWQRQLRPGEVAEAVVGAGESVLVRTTHGRLVQYDLREGAEQAQVEIKGRIIEGPIVSNGRILMVTRAGETLPDVLEAREQNELGLMWQFQDGGQFVSGVAVHGSDVFLADSKGEIVRFR